MIQEMAHKDIVAALEVVERESEYEMTVQRWDSSNCLSLQQCDGKCEDARVMDDSEDDARSTQISEREGDEQLEFSDDEVCVQDTQHERVEDRDDTRMEATVAAGSSRRWADFLAQDSDNDEQEIYNPWQGYPRDKRFEPQPEEEKSADPELEESAEESIPCSCSSIPEAPVGSAAASCTAEAAEAASSSARRMPAAKKKHRRSAHQEVRLGLDGQAYTKQEFFQYYGNHKLWQQAPKAEKLQCQFGVGIEEDATFQVVKRIKGCTGSIHKATGMKIRLRGRGSQFLEGPEQKESTDDLMLCISGTDAQGYEACKRQVQELLNTIHDDYATFCRKHGQATPRRQIQFHEGARDGAC
mmetsp:Transcript_23878/g.45462  ORF Transcript_23878/g.45462 Transcript_23878/m.45462 type:complete len:356 (+) Transcript_23878:64-1131(+)